MNNEVQEIFLDRIDEPEAAMRTEIDRDEVFELMTDIKKNGLINPITVRPRGDRYEVVAGHRRFLAHRYGGLMKIKCVVRELSNDEAFAIMTSENLKREDVNPVDEAAHVRRLMDIHKNDHAKVCDIVGRSREWVESRMAIAQMSGEMQEALRHEKIKIGVALALTRIKNANDQRACLEMAISQGASIVVANYWVAQWESGLFGEASINKIPDSTIPEGERKVVMLRCAIDGKEYPATDFVTFLVYRGNSGYVSALREHLNLTAPSTPSAPVENEPVAGEV